MVVAVIFWFQVIFWFKLFLLSDVFCTLSVKKSFKYNVFFDILVFDMHEYMHLFAFYI